MSAGFDFAGPPGGGSTRVILTNPTQSYITSAINTSTTAVNAVIDLGSLVLLSDVITALAAVQTAINQQKFLSKAIITTLQNYGMVT